MLFFSPAKVNLYFTVIRKRRDGYHDISSLFHAVNFGDFLNIEKSHKKEFFSTTEPSLKWDRDNLVFQAVELFRSYTKKSFCIQIHLEKNIPLQAGLGGGSSNAATTLWALNELFQKPLQIQELLFLAKKLGSDVPFFFSLGQAICEGRGEKIEPVTQIQTKEFWIVKPSFGLNTKEVFSKYQFSLKKQEALNDLEESAFLVEPRLKDFKEFLLQKAEKVVMTGSGSSFLAFTEEDLSSFASFSKRVKSITRQKDSWYSILN